MVRSPHPTPGRPETIQEVRLAAACGGEIGDLSRRGGGYQHGRSQRGVSDLSLMAPRGPAGDHSWINGGFFVLEPSVIDRIDNDMTPWEGEPLTSLAADAKLMAFYHRGFWQAMDTLRDKNQLEDLWIRGNPPWKVWA